MRFFRFVNSWESIDNNITQTSSEKYNQKVTGETSKCKIHENETVEKEKVIIIIIIIKITIKKKVKMIL